MSNYLRLRTGWVLLAAALVAVVFLVSSDTASAHYYNTCATNSIADTTAGAASDITGVFGIGLGADCTFGTADDEFTNYNSGGLVYFTPPEWYVASATDVTVGAKVGKFLSTARLGLLNNPCTTNLPVAFDLLNGTIDQSKSLDALPAGTPDRLKNLSKDSDGNGVVDAADHWPSFLTTLAQNEGMDLTQLRARLVGVNTHDVPGSTVILQFLIFNPGAKISNLINLDPKLGYAAVTVLNDTTQAASPSDPVSDFCTPLFTSQTLFAKASDGHDFRRNPTTDGSYNFTTWTTSLPDRDSDGIENALDPCPLTADPGWNPRLAATGPGNIAPGDRDGDGIPDSCDPFPDTPSKLTAKTGIANTDEDGDGWQNRGDNCPVVPNPDQKDTDGDGIGDACDPEPTDRYTTNHYHTVCLVSDINVGAGGTASYDPQSVQPCTTAAAPVAAPISGVVPGGTSGGTSGTSSGTSGGTSGGTSSGTSGGTSSGTSGGVGSGPAGGIGTLTPVAGSVPLWAVVMASIGAVGLVTGFGLLGTRVFRRKQ